MALSDNGPKRRLRVFLCHSSADKVAVRKLYDCLERDGFDPWLDEKRLLPAQRWADIIEDAVRLSDVVLVCLSASSTSKEGFLQREIKFALQIADEKPDDTIYLVPTRLEPVELPRRFKEYQAANLYEVEGYERLKQSLAIRAAQIAVAVPSTTSAINFLHIGATGADNTTASKRWLRTRPKVAFLILAAALGGAAFVIYKLYATQKQQHQAAERFYENGLASWKSLRLREAESYFSQAAAADPTAPLILSSYALSLNERGNEKRARELSQRAFDHRGSLSGDDQRMVAAIHAEVTTDLKAAEQSYQQLWQTRHDFEAGLRLAHVQTLGGSPAKALDVTEQMLRAESDDPRVLLEKANAEKYLGRYDDEITTLGRITRDRSSGNLVLAAALGEKCWAEYNSRDLKDHLKVAQDDCKKAEDIFNDKEDALGQARTLTRQALLIADRENKDPDFPKAVGLQKRAIAIAHERSAERDEAGGRQNLANILMEEQNPDTEEARTEYDESEKMFRKLGDREGMAGVENDRAVRLIDLCRYRDAADSAIRAGKIWHDMGSTNESIALANEGSMHLYLGELAEAESDLTTSLTMAEKAKFNVDTANWLITLGEVFAVEGKLEQAEQCFKGGPCYDAKRPFTVHNPNVLADAIVDYASLQMERRHFSEAEQLAQDALAAAKKDDDQEGEAAARDILARVLLVGGRSGGLSRARDEVDTINTLRTRDCRIQISAELTRARIDGRGKEFEKERVELNNITKRADSLGLVSYVFETALEEAEIDLQIGQRDTAVKGAKQLSIQAKDRGFLLLEQKAIDLSNRAQARSPKATRGLASPEINPGIGRDGQ